jgi:hypothetical protein
VTGASAHIIKFDATITAKFHKPTPQHPSTDGSFDGSVKSTNARCEENRKVLLLKRAADGSRTKVGTDLTDANGAWLIAPSSVADGTYFAMAPKVVLRNNPRHRHVCKKAVSNDVKVK